MWKNRNMCEHLTPADFETTEDVIDEALGEVTKQLGLGDDEIQLLEQIVLKYGSKSQNYLIFLTHSELPWCEKREGLKPYERSVNPLSLDTMYSYYAERHAKNVERRKGTVTDRKSGYTIVGGAVAPVIMGYIADFPKTYLQ